MWPPPATKFCWKTSTCHKIELQRIANVLPRERKRVGKVEDVNEQGAKDKSESRWIAKGHGKGGGGAGEGQQGLSTMPSVSIDGGANAAWCWSYVPYQKRGLFRAAVWDVEEFYLGRLKANLRLFSLAAISFGTSISRKNMNCNLRVVRFMIELLVLCRTTRRLVSSSHSEFFEEESFLNMSTSSDKNLQEKKQIIAKSKYNFVSNDFGHCSEHARYRDRHLFKS